MTLIRTLDEDFRVCRIDLRHLDRIDAGPAVRSAMVDVFVLASGGIAMLPKH